MQVEVGIREIRLPPAVISASFAWNQGPGGVTVTFTSVAAPVVQVRVPPGPVTVAVPLTIAVPTETPVTEEEKGEVLSGVVTVATPGLVEVKATLFTVPSVAVVVAVTLELAPTEMLKLSGFKSMVQVGAGVGQQRPGFQTQFQAVPAALHWALSQAPQL